MDAEVPVSHSEMDLVNHCNDLLVHVGLDVKRINSFKELTRAAPSLLVAVYESLFQERLSGIVRSPAVAIDYANNAQCVIDGLSSQIQMGLQHISGDSVAKGELRSLTNVIDIMRRIVSITGAPRRDEHGGIALSDEDRVASGSISTRDSFFESPSSAGDGRGYGPGSPHPREVAADRRFGDREKASRNFKIGSKRDHKGNASQVQSVGKSSRSFTGRSCRGRRSDLLRDGARPTARVTSSTMTDKPALALRAADAKLKSASNLFAQEKKLALAKRRRDREIACRGSRAGIANRHRSVATQRVMLGRWREERVREKVAHEIRCNNESIVLQRKVYKTIVNQLNELRLAEYAETKELLQQAKMTAECQIESLQCSFNDKLQLLREQEDNLRQRQHQAMKTLKFRAVDALRGPESEKQRNFVVMRQNKLVQKRENELRIAREECDHMFDSIHCMDFLDKNVLINQKNTNEVNRKDTGPGKRAQCRKSKADAMISSSRPDIMLELDKQVCDLVRQQQHASLSYGAQKCDESELALTMMQDENNPVRNCICATDFRGLPDGANLAKLTVVDGCKREGSHEAVSELEVRQARSKTKRFTADRPAFPVKLETWK